MSQYILHEFEVSQTDLFNQPKSASILYLRELTPYTDPQTLHDCIDPLMEECIKHSCPNYVRKQPVLLATPQDIQSLDVRLQSEWQLKAYLSFFSESPSLLKGQVPEYSRFTIHTTILVKDKQDVPAFVNIGYQHQCVESFIRDYSLYHLSNPVYILPEHPMVHGVTCRCNAYDRNVLYLHYHHEFPEEQILAIANIDTNQVQLLRGNDINELQDIEHFKMQSRISNDYAPVYQVQFSKGLNPCVPTKLILNKEKSNFEAAEALVLSELAKCTDQNSTNMSLSLTHMLEA